MRYTGEYVEFEKGEGSKANKTFKIKVLLVALISCTIIAISFISLYSHEISKTKSSQQEKMCNTYDCVQVAASKLNL